MNGVYNVQWSKPKCSKLLWVTIQLLKVCGTTCVHWCMPKVNRLRKEVWLYHFKADYAIVWFYHYVWYCHVFAEFWHRLHWLKHQAIKLMPYKPGGGGGGWKYSHIKANWDVPLTWVAFLQEILNTGPIFTKKSLKMGPKYLSPNFWVFAWTKTPKITKFVKNWPFFKEKSLTSGTLFYQNDP